MNYNSLRRRARSVRVGGVTVGGSAPIAIQSMTNTDTRDVAATLSQILALREAGCDIVRVTVPDMEAAQALYRLKTALPDFPIVADIHYDYRVALRCAEVGVDKIRINPGNIGDEERVRAVCAACRARGIPIRIGVNGGSLEKHILAAHGRASAEALAESAFYHIALLEKYDFTDTVISIKASDVPTMVAANRLLAERCDYPIHLGVTEAGGRLSGSIKSAIGIGSLLLSGIGDTVRVSLTADPVEEIGAARAILGALNIEGQCGMNVVSCPTCGRTRIDLIELSERFLDAARREGLTDLPIRVALMGCPVNGPGEAREADVGICGGNGEALLIRKGKIIEKIPEDEVIDRLIVEIKKIKQENER
ncbi:MAG: flavodoxin-dependent (E)-4-hydroxy-3-methylbut-2-enyl-diphosphate synthase [Ruminococcaceae bacterium]|nr:flavodoxin-dependent (E)-4-hydroxy-3-methylbut-2-enyl-diphosphate synthase [Oscillospiraceae bacterium]